MASAPVMSCPVFGDVTVVLYFLVLRFTVLQDTFNVLEIPSHLSPGQYILTSDVLHLLHKFC